MNSRTDRFKESCRKLSRIIERLSIWSAGALLLINVGDIVVNIFNRYVLKSSFIWTEELARYTLIWLVMLAANAALYTDEHMKIELLEKYFPEAVRKILVWVKRTLILFILGFMSWQGYFYAVKAWKFKTLAMGIPKTLPLLAIPVGMFLLLLQYLLLEIVGSPRPEEVEE